MTPRSLLPPLLIIATGVTISGCVAPVGSAAVAGSAAAGASVAAMNARENQAFGSREIATQALVNPALSVAPGAVLGGVALGSAAGATVAVGRDFDRDFRLKYGRPIHGGDAGILFPGRQVNRRDFRLNDARPIPENPDGIITNAKLINDLILDTEPTAPGGLNIADEVCCPSLPRNTLPSKRAPLGDFPWLGTTPVEHYAAYVMADTFVDEERQPWRAEMHRRFAPVVAGCKTRREAILKIGAACAATCGVKYSTARRRANQCVAESLETGTASCTGLSILLAAAYRSVGIPARLVQVAAWSDRPGNHTWVEVWDTDGWHFTEYYPDQAGLDRGWLLEPCARIPIPARPECRVIALTGAAGDEIYRLPWAPHNTSLRGEDRTAAYRAWAKAAGISPTAAPGTELIIIGATTPATRVARPFRLLDATGAVLATGTTPGPLDDANNAPRITVPPHTAVVIEITETDGSRTRRTVRVGTSATELR